MNELITSDDYNYNDCDEDDVDGDDNWDDDKGNGGGFDDCGVMTLLL